MAITPEQRADRCKGIGSSDVAAIMGVDPWRGPLDVYLDKVHPERMKTSTWPMRFGSMMEAAFAEFVKLELGYEGERNPPTIEHPNGIIRVNLDWLATDRKRFAEFKWVGPALRSHWGEPGTDDIPDYVRLQVQTQHLCAQTDEPAIIVVATPNEYGLPPFSVYYEPPRGDYFAVILEACEKFTRDYVHAKVTPPHAELPSYDSMVWLPRSEKTATVDAADLLRYAALRELRLSAHKAEKLMLRALVRAAGDARAVVSDDTSLGVKFSSYKRRDPDREKLKAAGLWLEYSKEVPIFRPTVGKLPRGVTAVDLASVDSGEGPFSIDVRDTRDLINRLVEDYEKLYGKKGSDDGDNEGDGE